MSTSSHVSRRFTAVLAILFLLPALIFFIMWWSISLRYSGINESEQMDTFLGYFPQWLKSINIIHAVSIICCVVAVVLAARSFKKRLLSVRILMLLTVLIAIFIILFDISQLV